MQKELYQIERSEVSLNISEGAVTEVRRKHIVRSGCRVYDGGKLGISGVFGEPDEATWQAAQRALTAGLSHPEPLGALVRSRETGVMPEERELLEQSEALLAHLREECPGFVFSNKIVALSERVRLENDLGRRLDDRQSGSFLNLVVKDEASPNVFDTGIGWTSRGNAAIDGLEAARRSLRAYRNEVPMPKEKLPVLFAGSFLSGKLEGLLDVQKLESGASLFSGKMGEKLFSGALTLQVDRRPESWLPFFDAEGSVLEGDTLPLIENGVLVRGAADRAQAARYGCMATAAAGGAYDAAPCRSASEGCLRIAQTHSYAELLGDRSFILIDVASGGDMTPAGDFATPVQTACLSAACRNSASAAACSTCWAAASSAGRTAAPSAATAGRFWKAPSTPERICKNKQDLPERNQAGLACYFASLESIVPRKTTKRS